MKEPWGRSKNEIEHRDTKAQSFIFSENNVHEKDRLCELCLLYIYFSVPLCLCVLSKIYTSFCYSFLIDYNNEQVSNG